jgi:transposase
MADPTSDQITKIKTFLDQGLSCPQICEKLRLGTRTVRKWLKDLGLAEQSKLNGLQRRIDCCKQVRIYYTDTESANLIKLRRAEAAGDVQPFRSIASRFKNQ